jgi:beta-phosphoglucomutase-like phosphatase (HAD superfamily)
MNVEDRFVLCDLDGTLADVNHRLHFIKNDDGTLKPYAERDWDSFNKACVDDKPNEDVIEILKALLRGCRMFYFLSGRNDVVRAETVQWLQKHVYEDLDYHEQLVMRKADDRRPDTEVKLDMVRELGLTPDDVLCILDDRQCVVDMWRENGFRCLQVDAWEE